MPGLYQLRLRPQHIADLFKPRAKGIVEQVVIALRGLNLSVAKKLADHRQRRAARNQQRRERVAQIVDANGWQFGLRPDIFPEPLDILKRLAFSLARKHPFAIFRHTQPDCPQERGGGSADRRVMPAVLLRGGGGFDPDGSVEIQLIPTRTQHFAAPRAGEYKSAAPHRWLACSHSIDQGARPNWF